MTMSHLVLNKGEVAPAVTPSGCPPYQSTSHANHSIQEQQPQLSRTILSSLLYTTSLISLSVPLPIILFTSLIFPRILTAWRLLLPATKCISL